MTNSLLPPNSSPFELALEAATARISDVPVEIASLWDPETAPEAMLPWLAWGLSIEAWDPAWPTSVKRKQISRAIELQKRKGTAQAVRDVVSAFGGAAAIKEWWQMSPAGDPHTFEVTLSLPDVGGAPPTAEYVDRVVSEIYRAKPVRSHFTFNQATAASGQVRLAAVARPAVFVRLSLSA